MKSTQHAPISETKAPSAPLAPQRGSIRKALLATLLAFTFIAVVTLPRFPYPGDNFVPRLESIYLAKHGELGVPYTARTQITGFDVPKGQYFYSNDTRQRFYSKYGIFYTVAFLPPIFAEMATTPSFDVTNQTGSFYLKLFIYNLILGIFTVFYLFRLAGFFSSSPWLCCGFTLATIYSTFLWHYLRAPALEIYQLLAFCGACFHIFSFASLRKKDDTSAACWGHLLASTLWSGALVLMKSSFVVLGFAFSVLAFFTDPTHAPLLRRLFVSLARHWPRYLLTLVLPWMFVFAILFITNTLRFGSPLDSGYMQWLADDGTPQTKFGLCYLWSNTQTFLLHVSGNDFNLFRVYPYALLGLACLIPFARHRGFDALLILAAVIPGIYLLLIYNMADGQWCYGPRYFIFYAMLLALPFLWALDRVVQRLNRWLKPLLLCLCLIPVFYWTRDQFYINSVHYFVNYQLTPPLLSTQHPSIKNYCGTTSRAAFSRDLFYYGMGLGKYYPIEVLRPYIHGEQRKAFASFEDLVDYFAQPNFYFFSGAPKRKP